MDRRLLVAALACFPAAGLFAQEEQPRPRHKVSAAELHKALSARFPLRMGVAGLLELQVSAPQLHLHAARNKLGATLVAEPSGPGLPSLEPGELDVFFSLRYEAADRTLRAFQPEIRDVRLPGATRQATQALQQLLPAMAREAIGEFVLHRFTDRELALADTMGFEPEKLIVLDDGLLVVFGPKLQR